METLNELKKFLEKNNNNPHPRFHSGFIKDLKKLIKKQLKNAESNFCINFISILEQIMELGNKIYQVNSHEILKKMGRDSSGNPYEIYSIHITDKRYNVRLLISFDTNQNPLFLTIFNEISRNHGSTYDDYKDIAKSRKEELMKGGHDS